MGASAVPGVVPPPKLQSAIPTYTIAYNSMRSRKRLCQNTYGHITDVDIGTKGLACDGLPCIFLTGNFSQF